MPNWSDVYQEIINYPAPSQPIDSVRVKYLKKLYEKTNRNVITYYSGFLSKPNIQQSAIVDDDKNGFMMAVHKLDRSKGLDLILHTPGGDIAATASIADYLYKMFNGNVRAVIPQIAMSAGTMLACNCASILMGKQSNLGPIDPQIRGIAAHGVIEEFEKAYAEIKIEPTRSFVWQHILSKYQPTFLSQCKRAIEWSQSFVLKGLKDVMFKNDPDADRKATDVVKGLGYELHETHSNHIHAEYCKAIGLKVEMMEKDNELQDLILTIHHCYIHTLNNSAAYKIIENQNGAAFTQVVQPLKNPYT